MTDIKPPCPFCGERQGQDEARPSKPRVVVRKAWERAHKAGEAKTIRETVYDTHCRACGERIDWSWRYGNGGFADLATGKATYFWSKP
jgi:hypothetical protein